MLFSNAWDGGVRLKTKQASKRAILVCILSFGSFGLPVAGADSPAATEASDTRAVSSSSEIQELKRMLLDQQRQIDELRQALAGQRKPVEAAAPSALRTTGEVAGTTPV